MKHIQIIAALLLSSLFATAQSQEGKILDKRNLIVKEWNTDTRTKARVLDHVTTYNSSGKKIEEIEYSGNAQKWRKRFEYGPDGRVSREILYDNSNHLVNFKKFEFNEYGKKKVQYTYDAKGRLITIKNFEYIAGDA